MVRKGRTQSDYFRERALEVYLLPVIPWSEGLALQQRLVYEISGEPRQRAALILCEHSPIITIGRQGSRRHVHLEQEELVSKRLNIQWTNRGGGCWLQTPGQLAAYPILPLNAQTFGISEFLTSLYNTLAAVLEELQIPATIDRPGSGVRASSRQIAGVGAAVTNWVSYHGCFLNVCSPIDQLNAVQSNPRQNRRMTSIFRELRAPVRIDAVRECFLRNFVDVFGFRKYFLCNAPKVLPTVRTQNVASGNH
jgi:lipoyl(octanoyl) transferase